MTAAEIRAAFDAWAAASFPDAPDADLELMSWTWECAAWTVLHAVQAGAGRRVLAGAVP